VFETWAEMPDMRNSGFDSQIFNLVAFEYMLKIERADSEKIEIDKWQLATLPMHVSALHLYRLQYALRDVTFGCMRPSFLHSSRHTALLRSVQSCCLTSKT